MNWINSSHDLPEHAASCLIYMLCSNRLTTATFLKSYEEDYFSTNDLYQQIIMPCDEVFWILIDDIPKPEIR